MKFPLHTESVASTTRIIDGEGAVICETCSHEYAIQIIDALYDQDRRKETVESLTYRQRLTLQAIRGVAFDASNNVSDKAVAMCIHDTVSEVLRLEAEEKP